MGLKGGMWLLSYIMNKLAGQSWEPPAKETEKQEETWQTLGKRKSMTKQEIIAEKTGRCSYDEL